MESRTKRAVQSLEVLPGGRHQKPLGKKPAQPVKLERCPEYRNPWALIEQGIAAMVRASQSEDPGVAMQAGEWLAEYAEKLRAGPRQVKEEIAGGRSAWD